MEYTYDAAGFRAHFERSFTWVNGYMRNVRRFPNKTAMTDPMAGRSWTYRDPKGCAAEQH